MSDNSRSPSILSEFVNIMARAAQEADIFISSFGQPNGDEPDKRESEASLNSSFTHSSRDGMTLFGTVAGDGTMTLDVTKRNMHYRANVPTRALKLADFSAAVELQVGEHRTAYSLSGEDFLLGTGLWGEFEDMHRRVLDVIERRLPWVKDAQKALRQHAAKAKATGLESARGDFPAEPQKSNHPSKSEPASGAPQKAASTDSKPLFRDHIVRPSNEQDLRFKGRLLGGVRSALLQGRLLELNVFETQGGNYVAVKSGLSLRLGEINRVEARVCKTTQEVCEFLGWAPYAKALYDELKFETAVRVE